MRKQEARLQSIIDTSTAVYKCYKALVNQFNELASLFVEKGQLMENHPMLVECLMGTDKVLKDILDGVTYLDL